ncbi:MAG: hypothetical protein LBT04_08535 [Prevotellaceae bacterium]|jgi:hypothetical protein|nr:hypothetical protein [Prevotellaceae bacterium]
MNNGVTLRGIKYVNYENSKIMYFDLIRKIAKNYVHLHKENPYEENAETLACRIGV